MIWLFHVKVKFFVPKLQKIINISHYYTIFLITRHHVYGLRFVIVISSHVREHKNDEFNFNMDLDFKFDHFNINVTDIDRSELFYRQALGLKPCGEIRHPDGEFIIRYLKAKDDSFRLELTWLRSHPQPYELGDNESHLALRMCNGDYDSMLEYHRNMGVVCFENPDMGIYFIHDPDDYWIEILRPENRV